MMKSTYPANAYLLPSAFYLVLVLGICVVPILPQMISARTGTADQGPMGGAIDVGTSERGAAAMPMRRRPATLAYITNFSSNNVSVISTSNNRVIATVPVGTGPLGVAVKPDGTRVYVTNDSGNSVSVINTSNNTIVTTVGVGLGPTGVAVKPDGTRAYVTNGNSADNTLSVIDTSNNTVVATVPTGTAPIGVVVTPDGTRVYVANDFDSSVSVIDTSNNTVVATIPLGQNQNPLGIAIKP